MSNELQNGSIENNRRIILIADYGRSGQGWLSYMLCYILNATFIEPYNALAGIKYTSNPHILALTQGRLANRNLTEYLFIIKTHEIPAINFNLTDKIIYLTRDPRDIAVSAFFRNKIIYKKNKGPQQLRMTSLKDLTKQILLQIKIISFSLTAVKWKKYVLAWENVSKYNVRYEDLSINTFESLKSILDYLKVEINDNLISEAIENFSFKKLTNRKKGEEDVENPEFRKGVIGDYKNHFTKYHLKLFKWICGDVSKGFGYHI